MLNLIKSDLYRFSKRPFPYAVAGVLSSLVILVQFMLSEVSREYVLMSVVPKGIEMILIFVFIFSIFFEDEYKEGTFKNVVSSNISRGKIYLGKCISEIIVAVLVAAVVFIVFIIWLSLLSWGQGSDKVILYEFLKRMVAVIPVFIGGIAISNFLRVIMKSNTVGPLYVVSILASEKLVMFLSVAIWSKLSVLNDYLLYTQIEIFENYTLGNNQLIHVAIVGIGTAIMFNVIGYLVFRNSEIK